MKVFHDSRNVEYRAPYGALELGKSVKLVVDVQEADVESVTLRTWIEGEGEGLHPMRSAAKASDRFEVKYAPKAAGTVWYHFIITCADGSSKRYGARDGRLGGVGELRDWEPPSFCLKVYDPAGETAAEEQLEANPVERGVVQFVRAETTAYELVETLEELRESLAAKRFSRVLEGFGSYDRELLYAEIAAGAVQVSKGRYWCASLIQRLLPGTGAPDAVASDAGAPDAGAPDVNAGSGAASASDAAASASASSAKDDSEPEAVFDGDCAAIDDNTVDLRRVIDGASEIAPGLGAEEAFALNEDVFGFWRGGMCVLVNRSLANVHDESVPMVAEEVSEVIGGYGVPVEEDAEGRVARVRLYQLGSAILHFHEPVRLQRPMEPGLGVLAHITSLPTARLKSKGARQRPGTLGAPARAFVDWLVDAGMRYWQVLPVNPTDEYGSPYAGISAFAGNTRLLAASARKGTGASVEASDSVEAAYQAFCEREASWLEPYAAFMAIREAQGEGKAWQEWPKRFRAYDPAAIEKNAKLRASAEACRRAQFEFDRQWRELRAYANERGVAIIGDMPIYVSVDSADVWANPGIFQLGKGGRPEVVAGCPPDRFAAEGQVWGNPVYDWDALAASGYDWWLRRLERAFELYDVVRLDHFIGFMRYFSIPAGEKATSGAYRPGPGTELFERAREKFGPLPIIAEDLGSITPAVRALVSLCGFPGMDIAQFVDGNDPLGGYHPRPEKVAYSGTHDNQTLVGYCADRYPSLDAVEAAEAVMKAVVTCEAPVRVLPLQDILALDDDARMNVPGTAKGNWRWQARPCDLADAAERARKLAELGKR